MGKAQLRDSKRAKHNKQKAARIARGEKQALESLAQKRVPFEPLLQEIVEAILHAEAPVLQTDRLPSDSDSPPITQQPWLEVGSGLGQLRSLLPAELRDRVIHTDVSEWLVRGLIEKFPDARARTANVNQLPFETASVDAVLGLCAFDSFPEPERASREIGRVLREGGRFIHFLDAATNIEPVLIELVAAGLLPIPNFLADIALLRPDLMTTVQVGRLIEPYRDVLSVPLTQFVAIIEVLQRASHPLARMLERYTSVFLTRPFDPLPAARAFVELTSNSSAGRPMNQALMSLFTTLQQPPYAQHLRFDLQAHSSLAHFKTRLEHYFGNNSGFRVVFSTIVYARRYIADDSDPLRARVRRVGIGRNSVDWPAPLGVPTQTLKPNLPSPEPTTENVSSHVLHEAAVYCLVAEKTG
jgi:SAM-dependent methyltransferase